MKITVVVPVLNEQTSVKQLIKGLSEQTLLPTEVVLVDGGSSDQTVSEIRKLQKRKLPFTLSLLEKSGANRSMARNIGIKQARTKVVALTDAGCIPKNDWLEELMSPFVNDKETEVVAGFYTADPQSWFEDIIADYTSVREWNFDEHVFLPSSRSLAITKEIWEKVKGYPEELETCEDLVFAERLKRKAKHWKVVKEAQVIWNQPKSFSQLSNKIFNYATGDLQANYERHVAKIHAAKWRILVLLVVAVPCFFVAHPFVRLFGAALLLLYIVGSWVKHWRMLKYPLAWLVLPALQLTVDTAVLQALIYHTLSSRAQKK